MKAEWISVKDKMPELDKNVLVHNSDGCRVVCLKEYSDGIEWHHQSDSCGCCNTFDTEVTHWMELPDGPEVK